MKMLAVLTFDAPTPEHVTAIVDAINPTKLPHFAGELLVAVDPAATVVTEYLAGGDETASDALAGLSSKIRPLGQDLSRDYVREVWNEYIVPTQADTAPPQSAETLALMSILRAVYVALPATKSEPTP